MTAQRISPVSATGAPVSKKGRFAIASSRTPYSCARAAPALPTLFCGKDGSPILQTAVEQIAFSSEGRQNPRVQATIEAFPGPDKGSRSPVNLDAPPNWSTSNVLTSSL